MKRNVALKVSQGEKSGMKHTVVIIVGLVLLVAGISISGVKVIDAGFRGVKTRFGQVVGDPLTEGIYFYNPITTDIQAMDTRVQRYSLKMSAYTKDVQQADLQVSINSSLNPAHVHDLYREVGMGYQDKVIAPQIVKSVKDIIGKWEADVLVSNREKAANEILAGLVASLEKYHIDVQSVIIENIDYSSQFERAIEEKQIAAQDAIKAKNRTRQVEEEARQKILSAQAEAESMRIRSEALSKNQNLVAYEAVQKWDGRLPVNIYGSAPIPFINAVTAVNQPRPMPARQ